mgnify:FL=1
MIRFVFIGLPLLLLFLIALAFGALNKQVVAVDFIILQQQLNLATIAAVFLALGFIIGLLSMVGAYWVARREVRQLKKQWAKSKSTS